MAQTNPRPQLVQPRAMQTLEAVRSVTGGGFDPDAWHVMDERDNALVADEILHGAGSSISSTTSRWQASRCPGCQSLAHGIWRRTTAA
jgi:hypothetical protein